MGGTFTDSVLIEGSGEWHVAKVDTRPDDLIGTVARSVGALSDKVGASTEELLSQLDRFALGTTLTTNLLVTRSGSSAALLTTRGHGDVLHIAGGTQGKIAGLSDEEIRGSFTLDRPPPLIPKEAIAEVDERVDYKGAEIVALDESQVRAAAERFAELGIEAVGIAFLWSFRNPAHELRAAEIFAEAAPQIDVTLSHALVSRMGEYLRFSSTAINAYCAPSLRAYMDSQSSWLQQRGLNTQPLVMQATGGAVPLSAAARTGVFTVDSGPVAGVVGVAKLGTTAERRDVICTDMGGTTFDVGLVRGGEPVMTGRGVAVRYPFFGRIVEIASIGSGGGSIAWVDDALGVMKVGPQSAGAHPGPACYRRGGTEPTVTDADVVLGFVSPSAFLGGTMSLDPEAARAAISARVAEPLGITVEEAAQAIFRITNGHMADFLRQKTVENGYDPRTFDLFAYGGAGPVHATAFARELGVRSVVVPLGDVASVYSALGVLTADVRRVYEQATHALAPFDGGEIGETFSSLERAAREQLREDGVEESAVELRSSVDMRYVGQLSDIEMPLEGPIAGDGDGEELVSAFHRRYEERYGAGSANRDLDVELLMLRVVAVGRSAPLELKATPAAADDDDGALTGARTVLWESGPAETPIYDGHRLGAGAEVEGPAVVEMAHTSLVLQAGDVARWSGGGTIDISIPVANRAEVAAR
jgi:N-methylhydantoinase A